MQEIFHNISTLRAVCVHFELTKYNPILDALTLFLESQVPIISVAGGRTSGKCAIVNSLADADILPSRISKPHVLYKVSNGKNQLKVRTATGEQASLRSFEEIGRYTKQDYDITILAETNTGLFKNTNIEIRTGFDVGEKCPLHGCILSDVILYCVKATALFCLDDITFIDELQNMTHNDVLICITHLNNVSQKNIPDIVRFVTSKHLNYPVAYYSDEPIDVNETIKGQFGIEHIQKIVSEFLTRGINYDNRISVAKSVLSDVIDMVVIDLSEINAKLELQKSRKYSAYQAKKSKYASMQLGWTDIRCEYEKRETKCVETILTELNKTKNKLASRIQALIVSVPSPKDWWENVFPLTLKNELDNITSGIDNQLQSTLIRDFNWLNHELQMRFRQIPSMGNSSVGETSLNFAIDTNSLSLSNLRVARYISMAGGASLATMLFFIVGPVGAVASASCSILGDRYIHKAIGEQRESLKNAVANVIDDVFTQMASMMPARVNGLYEEMAKVIAEIEQAWLENNAIEEFSCEEIIAIEHLYDSISKIKKLK